MNRHSPGLIPLLLLTIFSALLLSPDRVSAEESEVVSNRTFYVDAIEGRDVHSGRSEAQAWKSLKRVNKMKFMPGDRILFRAGSSWEGQLVPKGSGEPGQPITIDRYGEGPLPQIHGKGGKDYTLLLENVEYWEVKHLEITNQGRHREGGRRGVIVRASEVGDRRHIHLKNLVIRDVNGSLVKKEQGGSAILIQCIGERVPSRFIDLLIEECHLYRCERNGINFRGNAHRSAWNPSLQVVIRGNLLEQIPGDGIVPIGCDGALVEYNVMRDCPDTLPFGDAAAGIWPWSSDHTVIQFNEVSGHNAKWDGQGFDADFNCIGTIIQYNYSHDNAGGFLLICNDGNNLGSGYNIGTRDTIIRYNVSVNDGIREYETQRQGWFTPVLHLTGPVKNTKIHNNLIILPRKVRPEIDSSIVYFGNWGGAWPEDTLIANNIFIAPDSAGFLSGGDQGTKYSNNCYFGAFASLPDDAAAVRADPQLLDPEARGSGFEILKSFRLQEDSPCRDAGMPLPSAMKDLFGKPVAAGVPVNIGVAQ